MGTAASSRGRNVIARLALTVLGVLLMIGPPYALAFLNLVARFGQVIIAGILLVSVLAGFVLLYLGLGEPSSKPAA